MVFMAAGVFQKCFSQYLLCIENTIRHMTAHNQLITDKKLAKILLG